MWVVRVTRKLWVPFFACVVLACQSQAKGVEQKAVSVVKGPAWNEGQRYVYGLELTSRLAMGAGEMMDLRLSSEIVLDARKRSDDTVQLVYVLRQPVFEAEEPKTQAQFAALGEELARPFAFTLVSGKLGEVRIPQGFSQFAASIARTVAAAFQFSEPPPQNRGQTWTADEFDATGGYQAEYRPITGTSGVFKRKLQYRKLDTSVPIGPLNAELTPKVVSSNGSVTLSPEEPAGNATGLARAQLARVEMDEKLETQLVAGSSVSSETRLKLTLKRRETPSPAFDWQLGLAKTRRLSASEYYVTPSRGGNYDKERIGSYTFESALEELERQHRDSEPDPTDGSRNGEGGDRETQRKKDKLADESRVFSAMAALLRSDPKHVAAAEGRVRAGSPAKRVLLDAMASAGTPEAQAALVRMMDDAKLGKPVRLAAAFSLGRTELATSESVNALSKHASAGFLQVHAIYGLGTIARRLREAGASERSESIVQTLVAALGAATTPAARVHALRGVANSGGDSALLSVRPYFTDPSAKVRAAAIDAIRLMKHPDVDGIIAGAMQDRDSLVQSSALEAIAVRNQSDRLAEALVFAAKNAGKPELRLKAVRVMRQWLPKRGALRTGLEYVASNDTHERVRSAARLALNP